MSRQKLLTIDIDIFIRILIIVFIIKLYHILKSIDIVIFFRGVVASLREIFIIAPLKSWMISSRHVDRMETSGRGARTISFSF